MIDSRSNPAQSRRRSRGVDAEGVDSRQPGEREPSNSCRREDRRDGLLQLDRLDELRTLRMWTTGSPVQHNRITAIDSSNQRARSERSTPKACCSSGCTTPMAPGERRQAGEGLGEHDRVAARQHHHARSEFEVGGPTGAERQGDDRIGRIRPDPLRDPQTVEPQAFELVDHVAEPLVVQRRAGAEPVSDPDLHVRIVAHTGCRQ